MGIYTHVELHDQSRAIQNLPGPPKGRRPRGRRKKSALGAAFALETRGSFLPLEGQCRQASLAT